METVRIEETGVDGWDVLGTDHWALKSNKLFEKGVRAEKQTLCSLIDCTV